MLLTYVALTLVAVVAIVLALRIQRKRRADAQFGISVSGSRVGSMLVPGTNYVARAGYEVGGSVDLIIYGKSLATTDGATLTPTQRDEILANLANWGKARGTTLFVS